VIMMTLIGTPKMSFIALFLYTDLQARARQWAFVVLANCSAPSTMTAS
jgi:hypothetical protein